MASGSREEAEGDDSGKPDTRLNITSANDHSADTQAGMNNMGTRSTTSEFIACYGEVTGAGREEGTTVSDGEEYERLDALKAPCPFDGVFPLDVYLKRRHRDGSIYKCTHSRARRSFADRSETVFEAMMFTEPSNCIILDGTCMRHGPTRMLQIVSIKLAKIAMDGPIALYGYIALRDNLDRCLNYVVKFSRDGPIIVEQGSLINLTGPKRGIDFLGGILIEYDMRIKTAEPENHDLQLIDGVSILGNMGMRNRSVFTGRIHGDCGAVDITFSNLENAVEATVEVAISEVQSSFNLSLDCFTSGLNEQIRLFDGTIGEAQSLKRFVVAVVIDFWIHLKFKVAPKRSSSAEHDCFFNAGNIALMSVKVTWSPLPEGF
ncbi:uncharacterized protein [Aegilops tauschii subsp. strangulata]|nr:uncharacterized protein LOC109764076 [Aegilops tauschii subsp. strangulata]